MSSVLQVTAVSGGFGKPSRTLTLVEAIVEEIGRVLPVKTTTLELGQLAPHLGSALQTGRPPAELTAALNKIETADLLVVASPVYRASYSGLFKHLFDLVDQDALIDVPVLLAAAGGSHRHALVVDHPLRALFAFFQAMTLPVGIYAVDDDFTNYRVSAASLAQRIELAVTRALPVLTHREARAGEPLVAVAA
ncbi:FMN reductase [Trinickia fusca]|uniref:FMN reductase n=1 Tax=Trinickia fusca TaxID=2419777 RepID=A0A494XGY5_9BURK|nr:FMN reductase [Trinickia fusca]RKP46803.1 FMN reductase [Trinickia fusca]